MKLLEVLNDNNILSNITINTLPDNKINPSYLSNISILPSDNHKDNYGVYLGQQVRISWSINFSGKLKEASIGELPLEGNFVFECKGDKIFIFSFKLQYCAGFL